ncbi:ASCH domain-containing protein [Bacillus sp. JCM 19041]|uniref:ASCH domain-containing protein n=1 Tax=Bacillus sp. JCM 19041 TaxID=1460637 RepID=UPI0006D08014
MEKNNTAETLWQAYLQKVPTAANNGYSAFAFGDGTKEMADELCALVVEGKKTGTSSNFAMYGEEPIPKTGEYSVVLDGEGNAVAIIEFIAVDLIPYHEVTEEHAYLEGEGDRTLDYWRSVHEPFFTKELESVGQVFTTDMIVVCERFKVVQLPK